jgi:hypothetical protein
MLFIILSHCGACTFYAIVVADNNSLAGHTPTANDYTFFVKNNQALLDKPIVVEYLIDLQTRYLRCLYWAVQALETVGFGDPTISKHGHSLALTLFCILYFFVSAVLMMSSISNLVMLVMRLDSSYVHHLRRLSCFNKYAQHRRLPIEITRKVRSFYEYQRSQLGGLQEQQVCT